ncbi:MAG: DUF4190 domain-containing protein [Deltaproteobacteria bacterium]|nr:DUF4190 domain-containing protein [Deltaproteobacteria bacterium]
MNGSAPHPYGDPYRTPGPPGPPAGTPLDGRAIASMVLGIVATVLCCLPLIGPACGIIAIVLFSRFSAANAAAGGTLAGKGMAIAGLVCGIVGCVIGLIYTLYWFVWGMILGGAARMVPWR